MLFSSVSIAVAALAFPSVWAAPSASSTKMVMDDGITLQLADDGKLQRLDADGTLLGEVSLSEDGLEDFKGRAAENGLSERDENVLAKRQCLIGHPCSGEEICWYNGCAGCLYFTDGAGACYGSIM